MKRINLKPVVIGMTIGVLLSLNSCTKEESTLIDDEIGLDSSVLSKEMVEFGTIEERLYYKDAHLGVLIEEMINLDPNFGDLPEFENAKGDQKAIYIENFLYKALADNGQDVSSLKNSVRSSIDAFKDLEGSDWNPILTQVFKGSGNDSEALFLFKEFDSKKEEEYLSSYRLNSDNKLVLDKKNYKEKDFIDLTSGAKATSSVYLVSLALCEPPIEYKRISYANCDGGTGGTGGGGTPTTYKMTNIKIKDKKESWLEKADIHHTVIPWANISPGDFYNSAFYTYDGYEILKVGNSDIGDNISMNQTIISRSATGILQYLVFEHDNWPATIQGSTIPGPSSTSFYVEWRSWNRDYVHMLMNVTTSYSGLPTISNVNYVNNAIEFRTQ